MSMFGSLIKFAVGGAVGTAVGVVVSSLLAPQDGKTLQSETHQRFADAKSAGEQAELTTRAELMNRYRQKVGDTQAFTASESR
jgi:gas vesicle protein